MPSLFSPYITSTSLNRCKYYETKLILAQFQWCVLVLPIDFIYTSHLWQHCEIIAQNEINYLPTITGTPIIIFI